MERDIAGEARQTVAGARIRLVAAKNRSFKEVYNGPYRVPSRNGADMKTSLEHLPERKQREL
ncbi:hypothetical protein, partial [Agrobacterium sp. B1(2019)]|uniref:hypothetical protein n=1 Tax=Agrobacterium sp. B1(2019) TaxID=2607032 RepID=UPI001AED777F